jgi:hypothetical protein
MGIKKLDNFSSSLYLLRKEKDGCFCQIVKQALESFRILISQSSGGIIVTFPPISPFQEIAKDSPGSSSKTDEAYVWFILR